MILMKAKILILLTLAVPFTKITAEVNVLGKAPNGSIIIQRERVGDTGLVPPPGAVPKKPSYNVNPKTHTNTGKSAYE